MNAKEKEVNAKEAAPGTKSLLSLLHVLQADAYVQSEFGLTVAIQPRLNEDGVEFESLPSNLFLFLRMNRSYQLEE